MDAEIENRARAGHGKTREPVEALVMRLAMQEVIEHVPTTRLTIEDARSAVRVAMLRIRMPFQVRSDAVDDRVHRGPVR
ncbi:hypothetical protein E3O11_12870 [Cryobacterium levicorallinum]|uniref:Uncharacterized protein n=1 Tax=Cryobacterium levicorallinum TaxID=995038 RepID=A0A4R8VJD9_9MICO|nr:hypothetical protein [Cryobacterium levicorallinum]TFB82756.1 hypothetical protein E3O11_12870 [Cryobacterium levicorallinum]GEP26456.1 hypothetical protein CLE01_10540 [Cryobacterium levicorallinum]